LEMSETEIKVMFILLWAIYIFVLIDCVITTVVAVVLGVWKWVTTKC